MANEPNHRCSNEADYKRLNDGLSQKSTQRPGESAENQSKRRG